MSLPNMEFFQISIFVFWIELVKYIKLFKIERNGRYDINVTFISSSKDGLPKFFKFKLWYLSSFFLRLKKEE